LNKNNATSTEVQWVSENRVHLCLSSQLWVLTCITKSLITVMILSDPKYNHCNDHADRQSHADTGGKLANQISLLSPEASLRWPSSAQHNEILYKRMSQMHLSINSNISQTTCYSVLLVQLCFISLAEHLKRNWYYII